MQDCGEMLCFQVQLLMVVVDTCMSPTQFTTLNLSILEYVSNMKTPMARFTGLRFFIARALQRGWIIEVETPRRFWKSLRFGGNFQLLNFLLVRPMRTSCFVMSASNDKTRPQAGLWLG